MKLSRDLTLLTRAKGHVALLVGNSNGKSAPYLVWCPWVFCKCRYNRFNLWRDVTKSPHWEVMWTYGWEFLAVCHRPEKTGDHRHFESGDIFLIFPYLKEYVTLRVEPCQSKSQPCHVGGYWSCGSGDIKYSICHMTS